MGDFCTMRIYDGYGGWRSYEINQPEQLEKHSEFNFNLH